MSKKHRLINRKSYFNSNYNKECLKEYKDYFKKDKLNDIEIFEITLIYLFEKREYNGLEYNDVLNKFIDIDEDLVTEWLEHDLTSTEKSRVVSAIIRICNTVFSEKNIENMSDDEYDVLNILLRISGGEEDV